VKLLFEDDQEIMAKYECHLKTATCLFCLIKSDQF